MTESDENRHFSVTLPVAVTGRLDEIANRDGGTRSGVVRRAVLDWLRRLEEQSEEAQPSV